MEVENGVSDHTRVISLDQETVPTVEYTDLHVSSIPPKVLYTGQLHVSGVKLKKCAIIALLFIGYKGTVTDLMVKITPTHSLEPSHTAFFCSHGYFFTAAKKVVWEGL